MRKTATARGRHRTHHIRLAAAVTTAALSAACGPSLPRPPSAPLSTDDWIAVPSAPRTTPIEVVPPPFEGAVWVDGTWQFTGGRYQWSPGTWTVPPADARRAEWAVVRRREDGQLFFAPSTWKDAAGRTIEDQPWMYALGPAARARARVGGGEPLALPTERGRRGAPDRGRALPEEELETEEDP